MLFVNNITMKHGINRQILDPVLAPDQFGVAKCLGPEDLDRHVTRHGVYPAFPAPTGAPWSEYVRSQMNRSRSVSSSTATLDSDYVGAGHILGEGTTIFTNMTKTMLAALDKQMALCDTVQEPVGSSLNNYLASVPMLCRAVRGEELKISIFNFSCLGVIYCIYRVYCDTQLLVFRLSFLHIT